MRNRVMLASQTVAVLAAAGAMVVAGSATPSQAAGAPLPVKTTSGKKLHHA